MRLLYVRRGHGPRAAGDAVVDRRLVTGLRQHADVDELELPSQGTVPTLATVVASRLPPVFARIRCRRNVDAVHARLAAASFDAVVFSHETTPPPVLPTTLPTVVVAHNVFSRILVGGAPEALYCGARCRAVERRSFGQADLVGFLATDDLAAGLRLGVAPERAVLLPPGMPPWPPVSAAGPFVPTYVVTGTYGWRLKKAALRRFARRFGPALSTRSIRVTDATVTRFLPGAARTSVEALRTDTGLRFGLVTDDFHVGFKLKILEYIQLNCIVVFPDTVPGDFEGLPHHDEFVRCIRRPEDLKALEDEFRNKEPQGLQGRFRAFQAACSWHFDWAKTVELLHGRLRWTTARFAAS